MTFSSLAKILGSKDRRRILLYALLRVLANGLDIIGIAGVAALAIAFGAFASGSGKPASLELPVFGATTITEVEAVLISLVVVGVFISKSGFTILLNLKTAQFVASIESRLSQDLARDFFDIAEGGEVNGASVSDFQNLAIQSTSGIRGFLNARILFFSEGALLTSLLVLFLVVNPIATMALTVFIGAVLYSLNRIINLRLLRDGQSQLEGSRVALQVTRDLHGINREVQTAGLIPTWLARFNQGRSKMSDSQASIYVLNSMPRFVIETALILGIFAFLGGVIVFSDIPSQAGTIGVFLAGGLRIMASIIPFQGSITGMRTGAATGSFALEMLEKIYARPEAARPKKTFEEDIVQTLRFENVSFSHEKGGGRVLNNMSFSIEANTEVAIVGPSGAGKSTMLDLCMGFLVPSQGKVLWGDTTTREVLLSQPGTFAIVPQRPHLISGTIVENVSLDGESETNIPKVKEALIRAGLEKFTAIQAWEETEIRPDSGQLSGGEIQRISLARALYRNPKILFLDEATSALDAETELQLTREIKRLKSEMTVVLIAHRLSTVKDVDKIIYIDEGEVIASGTFKELKINVKDFAKAVEILGLKN